jgi:cytochrome c5
MTDRVKKVHMNRRRQPWLPLALLLAGCGQSGPDAGDTKTVDAHTASVTSPSLTSPRSFDLTLGEAVFKDTCLQCHGDGILEAPRLGNALEWKSRLSQGLDRLIAHAIEGHGRMPPKGGFHELSDVEVAAAVAYVVDKSKSIILARRKQELASRCHPVRAPEKCSATEAEEVLTLHMLWLLATHDKR